MDTPQTHFAESLSAPLGHFWSTIGCLSFLIAQVFPSQNTNIKTTTDRWWLDNKMLVSLFSFHALSRAGGSREGQKYKVQSSKSETSVGDNYYL